MDVLVNVRFSLSLVRILFFSLCGCVIYVSLTNAEVSSSSSSFFFSVCLSVCLSVYLFVATSYFSNSFPLLSLLIHLFQLSHQSLILSLSLSNL